MWDYIALIVGIPVLAVIIIFALKTNRDLRKIQVTPNMPIIENLTRSEFTNGYSEGRLKSQKPCKNGCVRIEFYPTDIEEGENIPLPEVQRVIVRKEFIKRLSRGEGSSRREKIKLVGRSPTDYPERMRITDEGKWATVEGQKAWIEATFGSMIPAGDQAIAEGMKVYARGQIPKNVMGQIREINEQYRRMIAQPSAQQPSEEKPKE